jgi:lipocalin
LQNTGSPSGDISSIDGTATVPDASKPGQLVVRFDSVPFPGKLNSNSR